MPKSLFEQCSKNVAELVCDGYWKAKERAFTCLSSIVIEKVFENILRLWFHKPISSADLEPLISSGRMRRLNLILLEEHLRGEPDELIRGMNSTKEIEKIFAQLLLECQHLESLTVMFETEDIDVNLHKITPVLNDVLKRAHNLKYLASNVQFDLCAISNCLKLEELIIHFPLSLPIYEFLKYNDQFRPHTNLKKYFISQKEKPDEEDIAIVLKYCSDLRCINVDISKCLELLHTPEFLFGTYSCQYKLEKLYLYLEWDFTSQDTASPRGFKIITETCPNVKMLRVVTNNIKTIPPLKVFSNTRVLSVEMIYMSNTDFKEGMLPLLGSSGIGHNLTGLNLRGFTNIDFSALATWCPNLQTLSALYKTSKTGELSSTAFKKLLALSIENLNDLESDKSVFKIVCNAPNLESLVIFSRFSDDMLEDILSRNKLSKLKRLHILACDLSKKGARLIATNMTSLIDLRINYCFAEYKIAKIVKESNPNVIITFEVMPRYWESDYANIECADVEYSNPDSRFVEESSLYHNTYFTH